MEQTRELVEDIGRYVGGGFAVSVVEALIAPPRRPRSPLLPSGAAIGTVWSGLFTSLAVARARLQGRPREQSMVDGLWLLCVTYPLYTGGMRWRGLAYAGNAAVATGATLVATRVGRVRADAARFIWPILPWVAWATIGLLTERRRSR